MKNLPAVRKFDRVKVALALGGGGARGAAHVGVLEVLERENIDIDLIVGCSAGAIAGALYADSKRASFVKELYLKTSREEVLDISLQNIFQGVVQGKNLEKFLLKNLEAEKMEDLKIPLAILATDLHEGQPVWLTSGPIAPAVVASSSLPPFFSPKKLYGKTLVDGGVVEVVPVSFAKQLGAELIIACDVSSGLPSSLPRHIIGVTRRSMEIALMTLSSLQLKEADLVIRPDVAEFKLFEPSSTERIYREGVRAAEKKLPLLKKLLAKIDHEVCKSS